MPLSTGARLGPYEILSAIGAGGMGEVYKARDTRLDRSVAIKVLSPAVSADPDRRARFDREAKTIAGLSHPHICTLYDVGEHDGSTFLVMEHLTGETLADRLTRGPLPLAQALTVAAEIADALAAAHRQGVIHRDLKPGNVMLTKAGAKLLDFGLAKFRGHGEQAAAASLASAPTQTRPLTSEGAIVGTLQYMAPEQVEGKPADVRTDLWALGAILYEMVTGKRAFEATGAASLIGAILEREPTPLATLQPLTPPGVDRLVRRCLAKDPDARWDSAHDVADELRWMGETSGVAVRPVRLWHWRWVLAGLLLLAVGTMGVLIGRDLAPNIRPMPRFTAKTFDQQTIFNARFMPDDQTIVYSAARSGNAPALFEIRPGTLEAKPFGPPRTHLLSVSSKGELAVLTDAHYKKFRLFAGTLARLSLDGEPRLWMDHVREADWSPDGSTLAIAHDMGALDRLEYPIGTVLYETAGYVSDLRVSPDGTRVAFMDHPVRDDDSGWVKFVDAAGKVVTLAGEFVGEEGLAWSPDGTSLLFGAYSSVRQGAGVEIAGEVISQVVSQVETVSLAHPGRWSPAPTSGGDFSIYDVAADGRWLVTRDDTRWGVVARGSGQTAERDLSWLTQSACGSLSADGRRLVFSDVLAGPNYGVVWRTTDGSRITRLGEGRSFGFSPDDKWALALINTPSHLVVYPMGTGDAIHLNRGPLERIQAAAWFPDSRSVLVVGNEPSRPTRAYRQDIAGGVPRPLLPEGVIPTYAGSQAFNVVAPDGQRVVARDSNGVWNLCPIDGGAPRPVAELNPSDAVLGWSADGRSLYVFRVGDVPARIDVVNLVMGRRAPFKELGSADRTGLIAVVPTWLADDGRQYAYSYIRWLSTLFLVSGAK